MTDLPTISVIVASWQRPEALRRCLTGLRQQDHPQLELCVVADRAACEAVVAPMQAAGLVCKLAVAALPNLSLSRNTGLALAAGEAVAFIDDDAVAEPTWASRLAAAFQTPGVVAATGFTRGRNGISFQWTATGVDATGQDHALHLPSGISMHSGTPQRAVKPVGTNCAFRRMALLGVGGFDPAYRFYLEDADIALRLAPLGKTAVVPDAQVHHGFEASNRRRADRVPLDLHEIGASSMVFLRRHAAEREWAPALDRLHADQRRRLLSHMVTGRIEPREVELLLRGLYAGIADGAARPLPVLPSLPDTSGSFLPLPGTGPRPGAVVAGRVWQRAQLARRARAAVAAGAVTTVLRFSPTGLRHRANFHPDGYWQQWGGLFGAARREEPPFRLMRFDDRVLRECRRWAEVRPCVADPERVS